MKFLSDILAKAGLTVDGVVTLNNTATGQTPDANDNSTKLATTAWVRTFVQPYSLPIASASVLGGIKVGAGLSINPSTGVLSASAAGISTRDVCTFIATAGQTTFSCFYTVDQVDVFYNGSKLGASEFTASNGTTVVLNTACKVGDNLEIVSWVAGAGLSSSRTITINGVTYDLTANRSWSVGTVTSVSGLTIANSGTDITSTVANSTTTPVITLNIPDASASARGVVTTSSQTFAGEKIFSSNVAINNTSPYDTAQFSLDVNGGLIVKNTGKTAQFVLINANPASGGNAGFVIHSVGGTSTSSFADIQGYYGTSIAGNTVIRLNPQGGNVLVGSLAGTGSRMVVADSTGVLSTQAIITLGDLSGTPTSRTLTINGVTYDLTANRTWSALPTGGAAGDILAKVDGTNYNTTWIPNFTSTVQHTVKAGVALTKGQAVYVSSADGTNMIVSKASNASEQTSSKTLGLVAQNLAINGQGFVVTEGLLAGLNTNGANAGDPVWLGTDGNLIFGLLNKPTAPAHLVFIGVVTRVQQNNGEIFVKVQNGYELDELHDLSVKNPSDGDMIKYVASTGLWTKVAASTTNIVEGTNLYYTDARVGTYLTNNSYATQTYVNTAVSNLVDAAPGTLNTLNELAAALGDDPNFATTVAASIGTKVPNTRTITINGTAYDLSADRSWTINSMVYPGAGIAVSTGSAWGTSITNNSTNWNTAYGWGNHASAGYLTGITSSQVTTALGFTPYNATNPSGYISSYTETSTLQNVILRNGTTNTGFTITNTNDTYSTAANTNVPVIYLYNTGTTATSNAIIAIRTNSATGGDPILSFDIGGVQGWSMGIDNSDSDKFKIARSWAALDSDTRFSMAVDGTANFTGSLTAANLSGTNTGDQTNISGNAATATNVAWTGVTGRPTALSSFTNDLGNYGGWVTSSGTVNEAYKLNYNGLGTATTNISSGQSQVLRNENGSGGNLSYAPVLHLAASDTMWQIQGDYYDSTTLRWRAGYAGTWYSWRSIYHSGNLTNLNQLTNGPGYITSYSETDTLASVTGRGASTSTAVTFSGGLNVASSKVGFRNAGLTEFIQGESWTTGFYGYNSNDGFLFYQRDTSDVAHPCFHIGAWNNAGYGGYANADSMITLVRGDGTKTDGSTYATRGLSSSSFYSNIIKTTGGTVFRDSQSSHTFTGGVVVNGTGVYTAGDGGAGSQATVVAIRVRGLSAYESLELGTENNYDGVIRSYGNDIRYYSGHWRTVGNVSSENHSHYWYTSRTGSADWSNHKMRLDHNGILTVASHISTPGNFHANRSRVAFSSTAEDANHSIYNNYNNIDGEGSFDGFKMNVYAGLLVRVGNASGAVPTTALDVTSTRTSIATGELWCGASNSRDNAVGLVLNDGALHVRAHNDRFHKIWYYDGIAFGTNAAHGHFRFYAESNTQRGSASGGATLRFDMDSTNGNFWAGGDITAYSDARVKTDVKPIENSIEKIQAIRGVTFLRSDAQEQHKEKRHAGVIAQEILEVLPEVVTENEDGMYSVAYGNMAGLFIEAIKELKAENDALKEILKRNNII